MNYPKGPSGKNRATPRFHDGIIQTTVKRWHQCEWLKGIWSESSCIKYWSVFEIGAFSQVSHKKAAWLISSRGIIYNHRLHFFYPIFREFLLTRNSHHGMDFFKFLPKPQVTSSKSLWRKWCLQGNIAEGFQYLNINDRRRSRCRQKSAVQLVTRIFPKNA